MTDRDQDREVKREIECEIHLAYLPITAAHFLNSPPL